jgi:hypothetical protein
MRARGYSPRLVYPPVGGMASRELISSADRRRRHARDRPESRSAARRALRELLDRLTSNVHTGRLPGSGGEVHRELAPAGAAGGWDYPTG